MNTDSLHDLLVSLSILSLVVLLMIPFIKRLHQPYLIAYIIAGILLGPYAGGVFTNNDTIDMLAEIGLLLHMFFIGSTIEVPDSRSDLGKPVIVLIIKTILGILAALIIGRWLNWSPSSIMLLSIILAFNSTAVVSEYLIKTGELQSSLGKISLNTLVLQDLLFVPALILLQFVKGDAVNYLKLFTVLGSCVLIFILFFSIRSRKVVEIPFLQKQEKDHDVQVFSGALVCFGFSFIAYAIGLTESFGAFIAGLLISRISNLNWLESVLKPFRAFFMSMFFLSIGLKMDMQYLVHHFSVVLFITLAILIINSVFSTISFRLLRYDWRTSVYGGALLSQVGELSIMVATLAYQLQIIDLNFYKITILVTCLSLLLSTIWITILRTFIYKELSYTRKLIHHFIKPHQIHKRHKRYKYRNY